MNYQEFTQLVNNDPICFLTCWNLLWNNGRQAISECSEMELADEMRKALGGFFAPGKLQDIARTARELCTLEPSDTVDFLQRSGKIVSRPSEETPELCPVCGAMLSFDRDTLSELDVIRSWICGECGATGEAVYHSRFALHRNMKDRQGKPIYPAVLHQKENCES